MNKTDKIYIAGHNGLVGSSLVRLLTKLGYINIITRTRSELDLTNQFDVSNFFESVKPDYVFLAAAKVGGINYNKTYPADFIYDNLQIQNNIIHNSYVHKIKKLLFLGSSCIYPKENPLPINENRLLCAPLEPTNEAYALAKIVGLKMCEYYKKQYGCNFISVMPCNLYGPNDCFDLEKSHVISALLKKFDTDKNNNTQEIVMWGTGAAKREFLYVDDLAEALVYLMNTYEGDFVNIGSGTEISMGELYQEVSNTVMYSGKLVFDTSKPDGTISKVMDVSKILSLGWKPKTDIRTGLRLTYEWYLNNKS
jgi:GDP-L-fucose synthase